MDLRTLCQCCALLLKHKTLKLSTSHRSISMTLRLPRKKYKEEKHIKQYIGDTHRKARRIYLWGNTKTGALGIGKFLVPENSFKKTVLVKSKPYNFHWPIRKEIKVTHIAAGYGFSVYGGKSKGKPVHIFGSGINTDSQLGFHTENLRLVDYVIQPQTIELPHSENTDHSPSEIRSIACGRAHTVIATDKRGSNAFGQCGRPIIDEEKYRGSRDIHVIERDDVVKVVCGHDHTLLLTNNGEVFSTGLGTDGQTGTGELSCISELTRVRGDIEGVRISDIDCRCDTVLAVSDTGILFGWGNSEYGQFDMITQQPQIASPMHLPVNDVCGQVKGVTAAGTKCALVNDKGEVYVWGYGILGKGPEVNESTLPSLLPMPLFGNSEFSPDTRVEKVYSGVNFLAALTNKNVLYTWGKNTDGCLGLGHRDDQYFPFMVSVGSDVNHVACGADHMITLCKAFV